MNINEVLNKTTFTPTELVYLLQTTGEEKQALFEKAATIKKETVGDIVYFRGLVEMSNICAKNCFYCGIRKDNQNFNRYNVSDDEIIEAAIFAHQNKFASMVLQSGELMSDAFTNRVANFLEKIHKATKSELHVTLSLGEQTRETYQTWLNAGAHRYLLRVEASNPELYKKLHPNDLRLHPLLLRLHTKRFSTVDFLLDICIVKRKEQSIIQL